MQSIFGTDKVLGREESLLSEMHKALSVGKCLHFHLANTVTTSATNVHEYGYGGKNGLGEAAECPCL